MTRPLTVEMIAERLARQGDRRSHRALNKFVVRAISDGSLAAYKANPEGITSPWLVEPGVAERWLAAQVEAE